MEKEGEKNRNSEQIRGKKKCSNRKYSLRMKKEGKKKQKLSLREEKKAGSRERQNKK